MAYPNSKQYRGAIPNIIAGQRARLPLVNGARTFGIIFRLQATAALTVAGATNLRNLGSVAGLFTELGLLENGAERWNLSGMEARLVTEMVSPQVLSSVRAGVAVGVYNLEEIIMLPMALPWAASPEETAFLEENPNQPLEAFVTLAANAATGAPLYTIGGATFALTNVQVDVLQVFDMNRDRRAVYIPTARTVPLQIVAGAPGADTELIVRTSKLIRAAAVTQNSDVGIVSDVINRIALRGDRRTYIGPEPAPWRLLTRAAELEFGGRVTGGGFGTAPVGDWALGMNFQPSGRLSMLWNPAQDTNWRAIINAQTTAATGATRSEVRMVLLELEKKPGLTREDAGFTP